MANEQNLGNLISDSSRLKKKPNSSNSSNSSRISVEYMHHVIDSLKTRSVRLSTIDTYHNIWNIFNSFVIKLDQIPKTWEEKLVLFVAHSVLKGMQSSSVRSYVSGIKFILSLDGHNWNEDKVLIATLTRSCKLQNDEFMPRLPIQRKLLEMILFETERYFNEMNQYYLEILYKTFFLFAYYGMMRVGELATGNHPVLAKDILVSDEKCKILLILRSSKTHNKNARPQSIKLTSQDETLNTRHHLFETARLFLQLRGDYYSLTEQLFIFRDGSPLRPAQVRSTLRIILTRLGLKAKLYNTHSFRTGRATDLAKRGKSADYIKRCGRWRSNAVYKYIKL